MNSSQIVYVLTNEAMPGLIKIGMTSQEDVQERMKQLYTTGVPTPFECEYACKVENAKEVEKAFHDAFDGFRINPNREFFQIEPERVVGLLKLIAKAGEEFTTEVSEAIDSNLTPEDKESARRARPKLNLEDLGIPVGSTLKLKRDEAIQAKVMPDNKVEYEGELFSLTALTKKLLNLSRPVYPAPRWTFEGQTLRSLYNEYHNE